jgi:hypothetical protein
MILHVFSNTRNYPVEFANFAASLDTETEHIFVFRSWAEPNGLSDEALARSRKITSKIEMIPVDKEGNSTVIIYNDILFDKGINDNFFTTRNMKQLK